ncbi:MAG: nucleotidyl transferase AbiEii/AbiGii toxin family protein [Saprospiraceae bacterium]
MLQVHTVEPRTLGLLNTIMAVPELEGFNLAGGTSLALQIGHRKSVDLDMFGNRPFEKGEIIELLADVGDCHTMHQTKNILILNIEGVKVDFVNYQYPLIRDVKMESGVRLLDLPDIAAMKLSAITGRGKKRDFIDIFFLLKEFPLRTLLEFYNQKYSDNSELLVARSLTYFDDADGDEDLNLFIQVSWPDVKKRILTEVKKLYQ